MTKRTGPSISELVRDTALMHEAVTRAMREAVLEHARAGQPVCTMRNGRVVWVSPEEVLAQFGERGESETSGRPQGQASVDATAQKD